MSVQLKLARAIQTFFILQLALLALLAGTVAAQSAPPTSFTLSPIRLRGTKTARPMPC